MNVYEERDAIRVIPLVSDDGGVTWYPKGGSPTAAVPANHAVKLRLLSNDVGLTWIPLL